MLQHANCLVSEITSSATLSAHHVIAVLLQGKYLSLYSDLEMYKNYNISLTNKSSKQG